MLRFWKCFTGVFIAHFKSKIYNAGLLFSNSCLHFHCFPVFVVLLQASQPVVHLFLKSGGKVSQTNKKIKKIGKYFLSISSYQGYAELSQLYRIYDVECQMAIECNYIRCKFRTSRYLYQNNFKSQTSKYQPLANHKQSTLLGSSWFLHID